MFGFVIVIHVIACIFLVIVVLLQAGKGGGLTDMGGTNQANSVFGTQTNQFMTRLTEVFAVMFIVTSVSLAIMSSQRGKSLVERRAQDLPKAPVAAATMATKAGETIETSAAATGIQELEITPEPKEPADVPAPAPAAPAADAPATQ